MMTPNRFVSICAEVRRRRIFDGAYVPIAGIVNEDVEATEGFDRCIDGVLCLRFVRDVERNGPHTLCKLASDIDEMLGIAGRGHDAVTSLESLFCESSPKAAGSPVISQTLDMPTSRLVTLLFLP
jgi:hypothetical protein